MKFYISCCKRCFDDDRAHYYARDVHYLSELRFLSFLVFKDLSS